jgi:putative heme iron utilization protein
MARLLLESRWGALAVVDEGRPAASMVAYAVEPGLNGLLMFLSGLSRHTRVLLADPAGSLVVGAPDLGTGDPQELPRLVLDGPVVALDRKGAGFEEAWASYHGRFPAAAPRLMLPDFVLFRLRPAAGRFVGGLGRAVNVDVERLRAGVAALREGPGPGDGLVR